jgi:hypothetical protein
VEFIRKLAKTNNLRIIVKDLTEGPRAYLMGNTVYLDRSMPPERRNFAFCHELAHRLLGHDARDSLSADMEREANQLAAELLLPKHTFRTDALAHPLDKLKKLYPQASWEVIARSKLAVVPAILTIFDNGRKTLRTAPDNFRFPRKLLPVEKEVFATCMQDQRHCQRREGEVLVQAYFVDSGEGVLRVLLWTEINT